MAWHRGRLASALFIKIWLPIATGNGGNEHDLFAVQEDVGFATGQEDVFIDDVDVIKRRNLPSSTLICVDVGDVLGPAFAGDDHLAKLA
jgi:hypothetical protein